MDHPKWPIGIALSDGCKCHIDVCLYGVDEEGYISEDIQRPSLYPLFFGRTINSHFTHMWGFLTDGEYVWGYTSGSMCKLRPYLGNLPSKASVWQQIQEKLDSLEPQ